MFCQSLDPSSYRVSTVLNFIYLFYKVGERGGESCVQGRIGPLEQ